MIRVVTLVSSPKSFANSLAGVKSSKDGLEI